MTEFEEVWPELTGHAEEAQFVRPFGRGGRRELAYDADREAIVFENDRSDLIFRKNWRRAWGELRRNGVLSVEKFGGATGTARAELALPFLADALDLPADRYERRIRLTEEYDE
ncbi:hypothetical protein G9464_19060 [Halostella sp. JP-L12]|uniref:hypothetical protein n=1 Tax=Halostella TaxID=1843185 RepID=UPI000EF8344D|nr:MULTISPECIES: hypothetical protein [Halostella]NHN49672.1 hypothetical protein [Halostella sp. JP-L12]